MEGAQGSRLFSARPANTSDAIAFTATLATEITKLLVCNNTASPAAFRLYHVPAGISVSDIDYALWYGKSVAANDTFIFGGDTGNGGIQLEEGESIIIQSGTSDALSFQAYGLTASIAPKM